MPSPVRLSPAVQYLQQSSAYTDIYTNAATSPLRTRTNSRHLQETISHSHPEPPRWQNPGGWGARHMHDIAPFTLWKAETRQFRFPSREEKAWIRNQFEYEGLWTTGWILCIQTASPPQPIPLTLGTMPVIFVPPGEIFTQPLPATNYSNPRLSDPCPTVEWPRMDNPTKTQIIEVLRAMTDLANVTAANFLPTWTVFELETADKRTYGLGSLPGIVAGRAALYHHKDAPFIPAIRSLTRPGLINPANGPTVQDTSNYLRQSVLTPGCRVESGLTLPGTPVTSATFATTCGVKICNASGEEVLTVPHHGFLHSKEVYHPYRAGGDHIGHIIDTRPELDIAFVKLTPAASKSFTNSCYFQATPPTRFHKGIEQLNGTWCEVDGMSSGLFTLMKQGVQARQPKRPNGHPEIDFTEWLFGHLFYVFGNTRDPISDAVCGAPIVDIETGGVSGFFHLSDGVIAYSATLDDLVTEGWSLA
ncbi:hypothetical protein BO71DRAFT_403915 [Aspergillus ellipticus CBS 707.79]|uniref:Uncharacterized protein n=1 Tax=Aspergillus ellipticus CBS 707.79 TaxID=1448320 RepID=A0A319EB97_9EURO|nr:hypothetical protein BO71DRAFT_403915 [Aspergillus ellipticus CBS 707.79]